MRDYRKADPKAPRVRKNILRILNPVYYAKFKKAYPDLVISGKDIRNVITTFHELSCDIIAETRDGLELMEQMGYILLGSFKPKEPHYDRIASAAHEKVITEKDWNSDGWVCKVAYTNQANKYRFKNSFLWAFESSRKLKRVVSAAYKKNHKKYVIFDNKFKLKQAFNEDNRKLRAKLKQQRNNG